MQKRPSRNYEKFTGREVYGTLVARHADDDDDAQD
jgi:hypothetical protein